MIDTCHIPSAPVFIVVNYSGLSVGSSMLAVRHQLLFKLYSHAVNSKYFFSLQLFIHAFNLCMPTLILQNLALFPHKACTSISWL
ncbi:hypothetical protein GGI43DRAFT_405699 [Trichoderma evansii]